MRNLIVIFYCNINTNIGHFMKKKVFVWLFFIYKMMINKEKIYIFRNIFIFPLLPKKIVSLRHMFVRDCAITLTRYLEVIALSGFASTTKRMEVIKPSLIKKISTCKLSLYTKEMTCKPRVQSTFY